MGKLNKKTIIILASVLILLIAGIPASVYGYNTHSYNKCFDEAVKLMKEDKFDEATAKFNKALELKKNSIAAKDKLQLITVLRESKKIYENAEKLMDDKKYEEAIELFGKVSKQDEKRYSDSQKKISECKASFVANNLSSAKDLAKENKFEDAIKILDKVLAFDKDNSEAASLKKDYEASIQKLKAGAEELAKKEAEEKAKKEAEEKARKEAEAKAKANAETPKTPTSSAITVTTMNNGLSINDNGETYGFSLLVDREQFTGDKAVFINGWKLVPTGPNRPILTNYYQTTYRLVVYDYALNPHNFTLTTRDPMDFNISGNLLKPAFVFGTTYATTLKYDAFISYKGKEYKFSGEFSY